MAQLRTVMKYMKEIDGFIKDLRKGMQHSHPYSVDALRYYLDELEYARDVIMNSDLESGENLDRLMDKLRECVRECLRPVYSGKPQVLPKPVPDPWKPPVTVTGVNIIFVCDISDSMFEDGGLEKGGRVRKLLVAMANEIERYAKMAKIPAKVSLVGYADPTDRAGRNRPTFWTITLNKQPVNKLANAFSRINRKGWARGGDNPESGMTAMYKTIDKVIDKSIVNGKPVENSIILVSDERQKMKNSQHPPHPRFSEVTLSQIDSKFDKLKIQNRYALIPMRKGYVNLRTGKVGSVNWNKDVQKFFRQCREYWNASSLKDVNDWIMWTLDPTKAPKPKK
ncbi:hypothetical protein NMK43_08880 [Bacillus licheniformis]|uniref:hypothetical protein n=1 Tax=Bacillus licheniformis TaxID=1402 RepID=UPI0020C86996|nr:hypothetical protein [Bacillus licheniformis]MCP8973208.1 hypothetical protein [Bacillus licheniformis]